MNVGQIVALLGLAVAGTAGILAVTYSCQRNVVAAIAIFAACGWAYAFFVAKDRASVGR